MKIIATNKKAYQNFNLLEKWECGIALTGGEVKSIRAAEVNFKDSYAWVKDEQVYLSHMHISPYEQAGYIQPEPDRVRKLLMHKKEIKRIQGLMTARGKTLVPTRIYITERGLVKVEIAVGQGKKLYDKRDDIKKREVNREISRAVRRHKN
ncbi:MAG: SsrA-binding protein SmpB [Candidatus Omnitrophica bacterium]|nr:SsrA-binding protein SmpB [Candidatus Omnitrophota bacterium]